jgi:hypothetical protein
MSIFGSVRALHGAPSDGGKLTGYQRDFHITQLVQECAIPESQAMLISGHKTRAMLERYNIVSLKNVQDAGAKLDAWSKQHGIPAPVQVPTAS